MRYKIILLLSFLLLLTACTKSADAEYLIGGNWVATAGFEDGEIKGEPNCNFFEEGLEFIDEEKVYNAAFDEDFDYSLSFRNKSTEISFFLTPGIYPYNIHVISENEMGLILANDNVDKSCYLERQ